MAKEFRLYVRTRGNKWYWGVNEYTLDEANARLEELDKVGIKAKVRPVRELLK